MILRGAILGAVAAAAPWTAPQPGRPPHRIDALTANGLIRRRLAEVFNGRRRPFLVARLSLGAELSVAAEYASGLRTNFGARALLASHAGVHGGVEEASIFAHEYATALNASSIVAGFGGEAEASVAKALAPRAAFVEHRAVEPFYFEGDAWTAALRWRRVLIVHPFADTIRDQYSKHARGDLLWPETVLPRDLDLVVVKVPSSLGRDANGTWSAALRDTKAAIDGAFPFDAALLGCGAYGLPLAAHVVRSGASAVYVGGGLQLLFGIMGKRWADRAEIAAVARESWVWPSPRRRRPCRAARAGIAGSGGRCPAACARGPRRPCAPARAKGPRP